jgi:MinD superfamily P-loop ATPase
MRSSGGLVGEAHSVDKPSELVVISGKGGTGKTSIVASFAALMKSGVIVDCDVDAADLHLVLRPPDVPGEEFSGGWVARTNAEKCLSCGKCATYCRFDAISQDGVPGASGQPSFRVDPIACEGCGVCAEVCPADAIELVEAVSGRWFVGETRLGPLVHARLGVAAENSGKLVALVRKEARQLAEDRGMPLILSDGPPGIGCPVIASLTGADFALIVSEPSLSAAHDMERVAGVISRFGISGGVLVNKCDISERLTTAIEEKAAALGLQVLGRVRYDLRATDAQREGLALVEYCSDGAAAEVSAAWERLSSEILGLDAGSAQDSADE